MIAGRTDNRVAAARALLRPLAATRGQIRLFGRREPKRSLRTVAGAISGAAHRSIGLALTSNPSARKEG